MKHYKQIPEPKWWKQSMNSRVYRIREYSAVFILIWAAYTTLVLLLPNSSALNKALQYEYLFLTLGLIGAIIHSVTWFFVTPRTLPIKLTPTKHIIFFLIFLLIWLGISTVVLITI